MSGGGDGTMSFIYDLQLIIDDFPGQRENGNKLKICS